MTYITTLLYSQFFVTPPTPNDDFSEQVVIVTGSNTGLGHEAVKQLLGLNAALVIIAVRTKSKGDVAVQRLVESTGCAPERLQVWELDLSNFDSIKKFGARVRTLDRLDAVIQNAGILTYNWSVVEDNESHITVNVIGAVMLGLEVLPKLRESASNFNERKGSENVFDAFALKDKANMNDRYKTSKLLLLYAVRAMAKHSPLSEKSNVVIDCMTPGACKSDIFRDDVHWPQKKVIYGAMSMFARNSEVGGRTLIQAISPALGPEHHGAFLMDCKVAPPGSNVDSVENEELAENVWNQLVDRLEKTEPGVTCI